MFIRVTLYVLGLLLCTLLIWVWNKGAQRRRFMRACPSRQPWRDEDAAFLSIVETCYLLKRGTASHIPLQWTPMQLYLTLYPEHCIYDNLENEHFMKRLHLSAADLDKPFAQLALCHQK